MKRLKSEGSLNVKTLNMLAAKSRNSHIDIVDNPFDTGLFLHDDWFGFYLCDKLRSINI